MKYLTIAATALALSAGAASAATFNFDEADAPGGDFSDSQSIANTSVGTAMAGFSSVIGSLSGECLSDPAFGTDCNFQSTPGTDEQDSLQFTIASGFELVGIDVGTEGFGPAGMGVAFSVGEYVAGTGPASFIEQILVPINNSGSFAISTPLDAGTYAFSAFGGSSTDVGSYEAFWNADFEVVATGGLAPVPLPAGFPLLVAGLIGLGTLARRKKST